MDEINSDFSRGSAVSLGHYFNKASKKVQDLKPKHLKTDPMIGRAGGQEAIQVMGHEDLIPLDNPQKSVNMAVLDLQSKYSAGLIPILESDNWEKQNEALNVIRQGLKYNSDRFNP